MKSCGIKHPLSGIRHARFGVLGVIERREPESSDLQSSRVGFICCRV